MAQASVPSICGWRVMRLMLPFTWDATNKTSPCENQDGWQDTRSHRRDVDRARHGGFPPKYDHDQRGDNAEREQASIRLFTESGDECGTLGGCYGRKRMDHEPEDQAGE